MGIRSVEDHLPQSSRVHLLDVLKTIQTVLVGDDADLDFRLLLYLCNSLFIGLGVLDVHKYDLLVNLLVKVEDPLIDIHDWDIKERTVLDLYIVLRPKEFDYSGSAGVHPNLVYG